MLPYLLQPTVLPARTVLPMLVIGNQTYVEPDNYDEEDGDDGDEDEDEDDDFIEHDYSPSPINIPLGPLPFPMAALPRFIHVDRHVSPSVPTGDNNNQGTFRLRMDINDFEPHELHVSIRHGRLIIRGKHVVRGPIQVNPPLTTNSLVNDNDDTEPDFISKEFKRTFIIPPHVDIQRAHARFYPQQQLLVVEIPFQDSASSNAMRTSRQCLRPLDVFLTFVYVLLMDQALSVTFEQYMTNQSSNDEYV